MYSIIELWLRMIFFKARKLTPTIKFSVSPMFRENLMKGNLLNQKLLAKLLSLISVAMFEA